MSHPSRWRNFVSTVDTQSKPGFVHVASIVGFLFRCRAENDTTARIARRCAHQYAQALDQSLLERLGNNLDMCCWSVNYKHVELPKPTL